MENCNPNRNQPFTAYRQHSLGQRALESISGDGICGVLGAASPVRKPGIRKVR